MSPDRERLALDMRVTARHLFEHALAEASIDRAFQRHVDCERGVLRIFEDLFIWSPIAASSWSRSARPRTLWSTRSKCRLAADLKASCPARSIPLRRFAASAISGVGILRRTRNRFVLRMPC